MITSNNKYGKCYRSLIYWYYQYSHSMWASHYFKI